MLTCPVFASQILAARRSSTPSFSRSSALFLALSDSEGCTSPLSLFFSHSSALFCAFAKPNSRPFNQFHTLSPKHPGCHPSRTQPQRPRLIWSADSFVSHSYHPEQPIEKKRPLSPVFATLTRPLIPKSFVWHSYEKKTKGVGALAFFPQPAPIPPATFISPAISSVRATPSVPCHPERNRGTWCSLLRLSLATRLPRASRGHFFFIPSRTFVH
jgi:hypothetical protein